MFFRQISQICCRLSAFSFVSPAKKKKPFQLSVFCIVHFHLQLFSHRTGVNSHPYGHKPPQIYKPYGSFLPASTSFLSPSNPSKYVQDTKPPLECSFGTICPCCEVSMRAFLVLLTTHYPPTSTLVSSDLAMKSTFLVFSPVRVLIHTVRYCPNFHEETPYGTDFQPYGLHKQTTF